ncbi:LOW QUALITY PROTEIN: 3-oxoacyl-[acyl-carrier protein] reductase [Geomicrobium sp. JCM 19037]|nr:LOW QUALITY PROTEIN: 3-oxoacyl-[acyl-carrier protein] reductase [Geomicrobium sp. JCM 19037]
MRLEGKVAVITGAGQGIGAGIARTFGKEGARIVIAEVNEEAGRDTVQELQNDGVDAIVLQTDVGDEESVQALMKRAVSEYGKIDILVNNAAINIRKSVTDTSLEEWQNVMNVNLNGPFLCSKYAIPEMQRSGGGSIINIASWHAEKTITRLAAYASAKGGLTASLVRWRLITGKMKFVMRLDRALIRRYYRIHLHLWKTLKGRFVTHNFNPMGRIGTVEDIANACLFLASDESTYVSGQTIMVDGGAINKIARPIEFD